MTLAEFEEKELEGPLNAQLGGGLGVMWSPGQVLERIVGLDVALAVVDTAFWASVGFGGAPGGLPVLPGWWPGWPSVLLRPLFRLRSPPHFRLNLFLQYKRPEHLRRGKESAHWHSAYFRFHITPHQQRALEACATSLGSSGLVAYGSPAFFRRSDLFAHIENQTLIANTHFAPVLRLAKHSRYTYVSAQTAGKAHSEPTDVRPLSFSQGPPSGGPRPPGGRGGDDGPPPPERVLSAAKKAAQAGVESSPAIVGSHASFDRAVARAQEALDLLRPGLDERGRAAAESYTVAAIFAHMSGVNWMVSG